MPTKPEKTLSAKRDDERALLERLTDIAADFDKVTKDLWKVHEAKYGDTDPFLDRGKFTTAGINRLHGLFRDGKRNSEIAKFFEVADSAIAYRRKEWDRQQANAVAHV